MTEVAVPDEMQKTLDEILDLPEKENETEDEWIENCNTVVGGDVDGKGAVNCDKPAVVNIALLCPFCGPHKDGKCEQHLAEAVEGTLACVRCSKKARTWIYLKPVSCLWKADN